MITINKCLEWYERRNKWNKIIIKLRNPDIELCSNCNPLSHVGLIVMALHERLL